MIGRVKRSLIDKFYFLQNKNFLKIEFFFYILVSYLNEKIEFLNYLLEFFVVLDFFGSVNILMILELKDVVDFLRKSYRNQNLLVSIFMKEEMSIVYGMIEIGRYLSDFGCVKMKYFI